MTELTVRQLAARLDDVEERHDRAIEELKSLRKEGAPLAEIKAAEEKVEATEANVKTAEEEVAEAKATLKRHGYELDEDDDPPDPPVDPPVDPPTPPADPPTPPADPPKPPKPDDPPHHEKHWSEKRLTWAGLVDDE